MSLEEAKLSLGTQYKAQKETIKWVRYISNGLHLDGALKILDLRAEIKSIATVIKSDNERTI